MHHRTTLVGTRHAARLLSMLLVNGALAGLLVLTYAGILGITRWAFGNERALLAHLCATVAVALVVLPLRARLVRLTRAVLGQRWQRAQELVRDVGDALSRVSSPDTLAPLLLQDLPHRLELTNVGVWTLAPLDNHEFVPLDPRGERFHADGLAATQLRQAGNASGYILLGTQSWGTPFQRNGLTLLVPLRAGNELVGVFGCAGPTRGSQPPGFVRELLLTLAPQIAAAIAYTRAHARITALRAQLQQLDALKGAFIENVGHELRTPLTTLSIALSLLANQPGVSATLLHVMTTSTRRLEALVSQTLQFEQQLETSEPHPQPTQLTALTPLILRLTNELAPAAQVRGITFHVQGELGVAAWVSQDRLARAIRELLDNAIRYAVPGTVRITTSFTDGIAELSISDQGPGIPADEQQQLFDPFFRGQQTRAQAETPGAGLGLSIARRELATLQGRIWIERSDQHGTELRIAVPGVRVGGGTALKERAVGG